MDEVQQLNAGWRYAAEVHVLLWELLPEIYCKRYAAEGVPFQAVTVQNEV